MFTGMIFAPSNFQQYPKTAFIFSDATFSNLNEYFEHTSYRVKKISEKQEILNFYGDCIYFGKKENKKLEQYINKNSIQGKNNIFDYYD